MMLKQIHRLRLSLAAKCQLLFGAAVILIIAAALFVPWQRMEQLTQQLNERTAAALARAAVTDHVRAYSLGKPQPTVPPPSTRPAILDSQSWLPPRLVGLEDAASMTASTHFDRRAVQHFSQEPASDSYFKLYRRDDGSLGYRLAKPLYNTESCVACHAPGSAAASTAPIRVGQAAPVWAWPPAPPVAPPRQSVATTQAGRLLGIVSIDIPSQIEANQLLLNHIFLFSAGLLAGTLAIIVLYLIITQLILQPVRVLQETAEKVAEGDLNIRSDINSGDEFEQLSQTLNTMLSNLKEGEDQLRALNKNLDLKLEQMSESNVALYESNRLKSEFLANVSHELRTPLNSILGFAELLRESPGVRFDAKCERYVGNILSSGANLLDLINDLLDLAKIEAGKMEVRCEPLSLADLLEGLCGILKPLAEAKRLELEPRVAADVPIIQTDPAKLQQVLYNFLSNAIKFSPEGAMIDLIVRRQGEQAVRLDVVDQGPGIASEQQEVIFEKFRQIDGSATRRHGGTGLGLAISRDLVQLLGGQIGVNSTPGAGATFWIVLPLRIESSSQDVSKRNSRPGDTQRPAHT